MTGVLLIPGLLCDDFVWRSVLSRIRERPVSIADVTRQPTITAMARELLELHQGSHIVIGHSMGGRVAMEMARQEPERVLALGLLNTGIHPKRDGEEAKRQAMIDLAYGGGMAALADAWLPGMINASAPPDLGLMAELRAMVQRMTPQIHERQLRALLSRPDASRSIGSFSGPMLLVVGRDDVWSPIAQHQDIQLLCPQAHLEIIENAGHFAPVEQPDLVADLLAGWIAEISAQEKS